MPPGPCTSPSLSPSPMATSPARPAAGQTPHPRRGRRFPGCASAPRTPICPSAPGTRSCRRSVLRESRVRPARWDSARCSSCPIRWSGRTGCTGPMQKVSAAGTRLSLRHGRATAIRASPRRTVRPARQALSPRPSCPRRAASSRRRAKGVSGEGCRTLP